MTVHRAGAAGARTVRPLSMPALSLHGPGPGARAPRRSEGSSPSPLTSPGTPPTSSLGSLDGSLGSLTSDCWDEESQDYEDEEEAAARTGCWGRAPAPAPRGSPQLSASSAPAGRWAPLDADEPPRAAKSTPPASAAPAPEQAKRPTFLNLRRSTSANNTMSAQKYSKLPVSPFGTVRRVSEWLSNTQAARDLWWTKLNEAVSDETDNEPKSTNIQVVFYDMDTNIEYCKTLCVRPADTVQGCIQMALEHLEMQALDPQSFQLWAKTPGDDSPYPLVGHERPFAIRMGCLRDQMDQGEGFDLDHCNNMYEPLNPRQRCQFILRNVNQLTDQQKKKPKSRKSPMRLRHVFKRAKSEVSVDAESGGGGEQPEESKKKGSKKNKLLKQRRSAGGGQDAGDGGAGALQSYLDDQPAAKGDLFGVPLQQLWRECHSPAGLVVDDIVGELAKPVMCLLHHVLAHGLSTQGIFRRSANQRAVKELRRALDAPAPEAPAGPGPGPGGSANLWEGPHVDAAAALIDKSSILTTSCALKEFLRSLPVPLLVPELCADWLAAHHVPDLPPQPQQNQNQQQQQQHPVNPAKLQRYAAVVAQLPRCHRGLLAYLLCLLHTIAMHSHINLMGSHNLGVVLAPSLLRAPLHAPPELEQVLTVSTPAIVAFLIDNCQALFGPAVTKLLGELPPPQDSGAEESDSLHSGGLDSLEHLEPCPPPRKDKMSLSRDSGLTMSDSQLFSPDEEESGSTSSSGSGRQPPASRYKLSAGSTATSSLGQAAPAQAQPAAAAAAPSPGCRQYVRVYGGWEERRAGLYSTCSSPRTAQLPSATSTGTGSTASTASSTPPGPSPFKREDWFRQRSALRRLASGGAGSPSGSSNSYSPNYSPSSSPGPGPGPGPGPQASAAQGPAAHQGLYGTSAASPSPTPPQRQRQGDRERGAAILRLEGGRQDRLRRSASEESLLERRTARRVPACERALPALPVPVQDQELYAAPAPLRAAPRMARSRSAYHLGPTNQRLSVYPPQQDLDLYGYACVRAHAPAASGPAPAASGSNKSADESYDSSTLSDDDSTPHVSRSNSRSKEPWSPASTPTASDAALAPAAPPPPLPPKLRHLPPVHVELGATMERRGRSRRRLPKLAARSKSLPPPTQSHQPTTSAPGSPPPYRPPPYRPPPSVVPSHRAPITTYYLGTRSGPHPASAPAPAPAQSQQRPLQSAPQAQAQADEESYV